MSESNGNAGTKVIPLGPAGAKRYFAPAAETTARQDGWLMVQMADAGILDWAGKELTAQSARKLVVEVLRSGKRELLLAGLLVEHEHGRPVPWTPQRAEETAEWFASLTDVESKRALQDQFLPVLAGFFLSAPSSSPRSRSASGARARRPGRKAATGAARSTNDAAPGPVASGEPAPAN